MNAVVDPDIIVEPVPAGQTNGAEIAVNLLREGRQVSGCKIIPRTMRVGTATLRMDGIGDVGTEPNARNRGYSRRVLTAALAHMVAGDASLTSLYGITQFYPKFGYITAGPEYVVVIPVRVPAPALPAGWLARPIGPGDLEACQALYNHATARAVGAIARTPESYPWNHLARDDSRDQCRVLVAPDGAVAGYVLHLPDLWFVQNLTWDHRHSLVLAEVVARDVPAASALLVACQHWAADDAARRGEPVVNVVLAQPPDGPMAEAAKHGSASFRQHYYADGHFMARVLHVGRLLRQLAPELVVRLGAAGSSFQGMLRLETDIGGATLHISPGDIQVNDSTRATMPHRRAQFYTVSLPQTVLARLVLGAFMPDDLLSRVEQPPQGELRDLLEAMFPSRYPHINLPDRF